MGFGGTSNEHVRGIPRFVLHNNGFPSSTDRRSGVMTEELELLAELEVLLFRTVGFYGQKAKQLL